MLFSSDNKKWFLLYGLGLAGALFCYSGMLLLPGLPALPVYMPDSDRIYLVPALRWRLPLLGLGPLFSLLHVFSARRLPAFRPSPLVACPLLLLPYLAPGALPSELPPTVLFWGTLLLFTWSLLRVAERIPKDPSERTASRFGWALFAGLLMFYTLAGTVWSTRFGEHVVDEGHYLVQAESLYQDRDLNIRNNFGFDVDERIQGRREELEAAGMSPDRAQIEAEQQIRSYLHISFRSPGDRWYSWHPYGLSILLAPAMGSPLWMRQAILALLSATGVWFTFRLCLLTGRSLRWSLLLCLLWALSIFYVVYAVRALPEALGATLFAAALYCMAVARKAPFGSLLLLIICGAFTPLAHPRFLPCVGLAGIGFFVQAFRGTRPRRSVLITYLALVALGGLAVVGYLGFHYAKYGAITAYPLHNVFGVYPEGRWLILFSDRGLLFAFPAAVVFMIGTAAAWFTDRANRVLYAIAGIGFAGMVLLMGAVESWDGGPTMYGRYLLVCFPGLIPGGVLLTEKTSRSGRAWIVLLLLFSASFTALCLLNPWAMGRTMLHLPWQSVRGGLPLMRTLFFPYAVSDIMVGHPHHGLEAFTANLFPVFLLVGSALALIPRARVFRAAGIGLVVVSGIVLHQRHGLPPAPWSPVETEARLAAALTPGMEIRGAEKPKSELLAYADRFADWRPILFTSHETSPEAASRRIFWEHRLEENDWEGRPYRWLTLNRPDNPGLPGPRHTRIRGHLRGEADLHLAIRRGRHTLLEKQITPDPDGNFDLSRTVNLRGIRGHLYYLIRLEGPGTVTVDEMVWRPELDE